jgi:hypothetical protein
MKKGVGSGSGSISQRCGSGDQNVTDPQHCFLAFVYHICLNKIDCVTYLRAEAE